MATISQPLDFCAVNLYFAPHVRAGANGTPELVPEPPTMPRSHAGWPIVPDLLYWALRFLYERYRKPIVITENGISLADKPDAGKMHDPEQAGKARRCSATSIGHCSTIGSSPPALRRSSAWCTWITPQRSGS